MSRRPNTPSHSKGIVKSGLRLRHTKTIFGVFYYGKGVTLVHGGIAVETYFLNKSLYARVDGRDVLMHVSIVGKLHIARMDKL